MALSTHVPDLAALEVLLGVAAAGSLNGAARQAGVSQQAVSARIAAMEAQTGVTLVHRTPRGSSLTAEGIVIAEWAARLLDVAAGLDAGIAALRADRRARLRVSASSTIAEQLLPAWLASFRAAAGRGSPAPDVVLTAGREGGSGTRDALTAALGAVLGPGTAQASAALSLSTTAALRSAVLAGAAPAVISELAVADDLAAGRLAEARTPDLDLRRSLRAIWDGTKNPPAGAARDLLSYILSRRLPLHGNRAIRGLAERARQQPQPVQPARRA